MIVVARSRSRTRRAARSLPRGELVVHAEGYGFVRTAEGEYFVPAARLGGAFDGDVVEISPLPAAASKSYRSGDRPSMRSGGRPAARVVRVIERAHESLIGRYEVADPFGVVIPEDPRIPYDIFTQRSAAPGVPDGALVRVRISTYPSRNTAATGVVEEVLGEADAPRLGIESVIARHKIETRFSEACRTEAEDLSLDVAGALACGYADLRERCVFTIDPIDARDFDDALSLERVDDGARPDPAVSFAGFSSTGLSAKCDSADHAPVPALSGVGWEGAVVPVWRLGVHIADVSAYVPWGSAIDLDARNRSTSVYLVDRVVPMLPERLSNDLCSLRPDEDRLSMTVDLLLDAQGRIAGFELYPAVIRSKARLAYDQVQIELEREGACGEGASRPFEGEWAGCAPEALCGARASSGMTAGAQDGAIPGEVRRRLAPLARIAKQRAALRRKAGGIDFPSTEAKVRLDAEGRPVGVDLRRKTDATSLVEEAMILANEAVARCLVAAGSPGLFRVHERPAADGLAGLVPVLEEFDWFARIDTARFAMGDPFAIQAALEESRGRSEGELVGSLLLRAMKRADYRPACEGHYGLASKAYAHFTSPIRRYPDLVDHRMLKALLFGRPELFDQEASALRWLGSHCSERERAADAAGRESQEIKLIELLEDRVGEAFSGVVSGVAPYGLYVRLDNTAEGILPVRRLGAEYFALDAELHRLVGQDSGKVWRLGQRIAVVLAVADARRHVLEFRLAGSA